MFHTHSGWYFTRNEDGSVHVEHRVQMRKMDESGMYAPYYFVDAQHDLTSDAWASVVATVSAAGETGETWRAARAFHLGKDDYPDYKTAGYEYAKQLIEEGNAVVLSYEMRNGGLVTVAEIRNLHSGEMIAGINHAIFVKLADEKAIQTYTASTNGKKLETWFIAPKKHEELTSEF